MRAKAPVRKAAALPTIERGSGDLKEFLDANRKKSRLLGKVDQWLMLQEDEFRRTDIIHPSEMAKEDWCHRASYFLLSGHPKPKEKMKLRSENIFDEGHYIHEKWQSRFAKMGNLYGTWEERVADAEGNKNMLLWERSCDVDLERYKYKEVLLYTDWNTTRIEGHSDGWVMGMGDDTLIEAKSMGDGTVRAENPALFMKHSYEVDKDKTVIDVHGLFNDIKRPFPGHRIQGSIYLEIAHQMDLAGLLRFPAPEEIVYIYEFKLNQAYKEFIVRRNPGIVAPLFEIAATIVEAVDMGTPLACNLDVQKGCKACRPFEGVK
jgi:hypothetical protein